MADPTTARPAAPAHAGPAGSLAAVHRQWRALWRDVKGLVSDRVELLALELQRAVQAVVEIVALLVAIAVLGVTAWLVLWAVVIRLLVDAGLPLPAALLLAIAFNVGVIVLALLRVRKLLPRLSLAATRRHLTLGPDSDSDSDSDSDPAPEAPLDEHIPAVQPAR